MLLSILVVSRTSSLLNEMVNSIENATKILPTNLEILCSWNGSTNEIKNIDQNSFYKVNIAQKKKYHFARNINSLIRKSKGDLILIINDDVILDPHSIDKAIMCLENHQNIGLVGSKLRNRNRIITHSGILFNIMNFPYHRLEGLAHIDHIIINQKAEKISAATGALMLIPKNILTQVKMNENYNVCGEDVELCLDIRENLNKDIIYCPDFSGIHESEQTRRTQDNQAGNEEDLVKLRVRRRKFLEKAKKSQILNELLIAQKGIDALRVIIDESLDVQKQIKSSQEIAEEQTHSLHLYRISLNQEVSKLRKELALLNSGRLEQEETQKN